MSDRRPAAKPAMWLAALLDPPSVSDRAGAATPRAFERALALLLDVRLADYQRLAAASEWPALGTSPNDAGSAQARIVAALALQLGGSGEAVGHFMALSRNESTNEELRLVARVLGSIALRDAGRPDLAETLMAESIPKAGQQRALALIHLGLAQRESGDAAAAFETAVAAERAVGRHRGSRLGQALAAVASRNARSFGFSAGLKSHLRRATRSPLLDQIESRAAAGLASFVEQEFDGRLQDPTRVSMSFRQEDPVQTPLMAALLRSEALGDWNQIQEARRRLGRYQLLASVGIAEREPVPALHVMRRAGEIKGLKQAIRWYRSQGPLMPLRQYGGGLAVSPWSQSTLQADLVSISETADVLAPSDAAVALARILSNLDEMLRRTPHIRLESEVNEAVSNLAPLVPELHRQIAERYRAVLSNSDDPLLVQSAADVVRSLDWASVDAAESAWWYEYCIHHLTGVSDHRFVAASLLRALPATEELRSAALAAFQSQPDILTAVNALSLGPLPTSTLQKIADLARGETKRIRREAATGSHGLGALVDVGQLLTRLLLDHPHLSGWRDLLAFLRDPLVASSSKLGPLAQVQSRAAAVPPFVHNGLRSWVTRPVSYVELPMESPQLLRGTILRLRLTYETRPAERLLSEMLELAADSSREARLEAARTLPTSVGRVPNDTVLTLALTLSRDPAPEVRATAGRALAQLGLVSGRDLSRLAWERLVALLEDRGSVVPKWVAVGLAELPAREWPPEVTHVLTDVAERHLSHSVRVAVRYLLAAPTVQAASARPARR